MNHSDFHQILRLIFALVFVLALMGCLKVAVQRFGSRQVLGGNKKRRLGIVETLQLDARRKLVLLKRDGYEHLVIFGTNGETVIESHIESGQDGAHDTPASIATDGPSSAE